MRQGLCRYAMTGIAYGDIHQMVLSAAAALHADIDVALVGIFDGIRDEIIHDDGDDLLVDIHLYLLFGSHKPDGDIGFLRQFLVFQGNLVYGIHHIGLLHTKLPVVGLSLSEFQNLRNQRACHDTGCSPHCLKWKRHHGHCAGNYEPPDAGYR